MSSQGTTWASTRAERHNERKTADTYVSAVLRSPFLYQMLSAVSLEKRTSQGQHGKQKEQSDTMNATSYKCNEWELHMQKLEHNCSEK